MQTLQRLQFAVLELVLRLQVLVLAALLVVGDHAGAGAAAEHQLAVGADEVGGDEAEEGKEKEEFVPLNGLLLGEADAGADGLAGGVLRRLEVLLEDVHSRVVE